MLTIFMKEQNERAKFNFNSCRAGFLTVKKKKNEYRNKCQISSTELFQRERERDKGEKKSDPLNQLMKIQTKSKQLN